MEVIVNNNMAKDHKLYNAISAIPAEKYLEFYKQIVPQNVLDKMEDLNVAIKNMDFFGFDTLSFDFKPQFKKDEKNGEVDVLSLDYLKSFSEEFEYYFSFDLYRFIATDDQVNLKSYTDLWQKFLSDNLGEKAYRKLFAEKLKTSNDAYLEHTKAECKSLIEKLNTMKKYQAQLEKEKEQFEAEYAGVLDEKGNVLPIEESDFNKNV